MGLDTETSNTIQQVMAIFGNVVRARDPADPRAATHFEFEMGGPGGYASGSTNL